MVILRMPDALDLKYDRRDQDRIISSPVAMRKDVEEPRSLMEHLQIIISAP